MGKEEGEALGPPAAEDAQPFWDEPGAFLAPSPSDASHYQPFHSVRSRFRNCVWPKETERQVFTESHHSQETFYVAPDGFEFLKSQQLKQTFELCFLKDENTRQFLII